MASEKCCHKAKEQEEGEVFETCSLHDLPAPNYTPPKDNFFVVYACYFICGVAMLLPWNAFITANAFFSMKFEHSNFKDNFMLYFSMTFMVFKLFGVGGAVKMQDKIFSFPSQILISLLVNTAVFLTLTITTVVEFGNPNAYFGFILVLMMFTAFSTASIHNGVFAIVSQFPPIYMQAVVSGQGVAGVAMALSSLVTDASFAKGDSKATAEDKQWSAFWYFLFATVVSAGAIFSNRVMSVLPFYKHYSTIATSDDEKLESDKVVSNETSFQSLLRVSQKIFPYAFTTFFVFAVTLATFPWMTVSVKPISDDNKMYKELFVGIHFLIFNVADWIGRLFPMIPILNIKHRLALPLMSASRVLFIVLFALCNIELNENPVFGDAAYFVFLALFSASNGWISTLGLMGAPHSVIREDSTWAGTLMSFYLTAGLTFGSIFGFALEAMIAKFFNK